MANPSGQKCGVTFSWVKFLTSPGSASERLTNTDRRFRRTTIRRQRLRKPESTCRRLIRETTSRPRRVIGRRRRSDSKLTHELQAAQLGGLFLFDAASENQHLERLAHPGWSDQVFELQRNLR